MVEHVPVALSIDALAQQMARRDGAPAGSVVVVDSEIAGRLRGGVEWRSTDAVAVAAIARPVALDPASAAVAWLASGLAAVDAISGLTGAEPECWWPDLVALPTSSDVRIVTGAMTLLGPGRVEVAILMVRIDRPTELDVERDELVDGLGEALRGAMPLLDGPELCAERYRACSSLLGYTVTVQLLPSGSMRGRVTGFGADGALEVTTPTGLVERVPISSTAHVTVDDRGDHPAYEPPE